MIKTKAPRTKVLTQRGSGEGAKKFLGTTKIVLTQRGSGEGAKNSSEPQK